jgi:hypothetical protein
VVLFRILKDRESQTIYAFFKNRPKPRFINTAVSIEKTPVKLTKILPEPRFSLCSPWYLQTAVLADF